MKIFFGVCVLLVFSGCTKHFNLGKSIENMMKDPLWKKNPQVADVRPLDAIGWGGVYSVQCKNGVAQPAILEDEFNSPGLCKAASFQGPSIYASRRVDLKAPGLAALGDEIKKAEAEAINACHSASAAYKSCLKIITNIDKSVMNSDGGITVTLNSYYEGSN